MGEKKEEEEAATEANGYFTPVTAILSAIPDSKGKQVKKEVDEAIGRCDQDINIKGDILKAKEAYIALEEKSKGSEDAQDALTKARLAMHHYAMLIATHAFMQAKHEDEEATFAAWLEEQKEIKSALESIDAFTFV